MPPPLYIPKAKAPMVIAVFVSGGGGNLAAALRLQDMFPHLIRVGAVVTDRLGTQAAMLARQRDLPLLEQDFETRCGSRQQCHTADSLAKYLARGEEFHNDVLDWLLATATRAPVDLLVLSYRRLIRGRLLETFRDRIINQHAGDLAVRVHGNRTYTGISAVRKAFIAGESFTRTTTILVDSGCDTGEILCRGPKLRVTNPTPNRENEEAQERTQKAVSDWPSLQFALAGIAQGRFAIDTCQRHDDGRRLVLFDSAPLPYGGVSLHEDFFF
jgi:folate-dependent phosphoribosylglycinamide formyltransferase PurN